VWPIWRELLPHVLAATDPGRPLDDVPDELSTLLDRAGLYLHTWGQPRAALPLLERSYAADRARLGDDAPFTLTSAGNLADTLSELGEHQQARELNEDTLTRHRRTLGDDHPNTLNSANNLANNLSDLGEHQQARELNEDTLTRRRRVLGDDHPDTRRAVRNLATVLTTLGNAERAVALLAELGLDP
jgi:hypothetical protein